VVSIRCSQVDVVLVVLVTVPGGSVVSIRCSQTFQPRTAQLSLFGIPLWYSTNSPRVAIQVCV